MEIRVGGNLMCTRLFLTVTSQNEEKGRHHAVLTIVQGYTNVLQHDGTSKVCMHVVEQCKTLFQNSNIGNSQQLVRNYVVSCQRKKLPDKSINAPIVFILIYDKANTYLQHICYYQIEEEIVQTFFI
jgi:hypothetical protein